MTARNIDIMNFSDIAYCSDKYQYTMGKSFYECGRKDKIAVFNMFYRVAPENNNWAVVSGTEEVVEMILSMGDKPESFFEKFCPETTTPSSGNISQGCASPAMSMR